MPRAFHLYVIAAATALWGCGTQEPTTSAISSPELAANLAAAEALATGPVAAADNAKFPDFDPSEFVAVVDNPYFPLQRGTRLTYTGTDDGAPLKNVTEVSNRRMSIVGVDVFIVSDKLYNSGSLVEKTTDYYAQDDDGNVWYFGEDTKEFDHGTVISTAGTWLAGKDGARPGIIMRAHPKVGQTTQQEFAAGVAEDMATVLRLNSKVTVPFGSFRRCVETEDFTPLHPGATEIKNYCPGIGLTKSRDVTGGTVQLELVKITH